MNSLRALTTHENSASVQFSEKMRCFVRAKRRCRGLTRVLDRALPVADHETCARCGIGGAETRKNESKKRRLSGFRFGDIKPTKKRRADNSFVQTAPIRPSKEPKKCRAVNDCLHGIGVDRDVELYVSGKPFTGRNDICSVTLMTYIRKTLKWIPVATQVPIYSPSLGIATAIDLLCIDAATRTQLHLVEIKATRARGTGEAIDNCYTTSANRATGNLRGLPMSRYSSHQMQLWCMQYIVQKECNVTLASSVVLRTSPKRVFCYPLNTWFNNREKALVKRIYAVAAKKNYSKKTSIIL